MHAAEAVLLLCSMSDVNAFFFPVDLSLHDFKKSRILSIFQSLKYETTPVIPSSQSVVCLLSMIPECPNLSFYGGRR